MNSLFRRTFLVGLLLVSLLGLAGCIATTTPYYVTSDYNYSSSRANYVYYEGPHPVYDINSSYDWCNTSGKHSHLYAPDSYDFFVRDGNYLVFVGDPSFYVSNINFNTYHYMGVHPLPVGNGWCYITGPHRHHWSSSGYYNYSRYGNHNYYTYYGPYNQYYVESRTHYNLNDYYRKNPPPRYAGNRGDSRQSVGMSYYNNARPNNNNYASRPNHDSRPVNSPPAVSGSRPATSTTTVSGSRPASTTINSGSRPASTTTAVSGSRPASTTINSGSRPASSTTINSGSRPASSTVNTGSSYTGRTSTPSGKNSYDTASTGSRASSTSSSSSRPSSAVTSGSRPASSSSAAPARGNYRRASSASDEDDERRPAASGSRSSASSNSRAATSSRGRTSRSSSR